MLKSYGVGWMGWVVCSVAHVILVSAQVLLVLTLGLWTSDLGLTILHNSGINNSEIKKVKHLSKGEKKAQVDVTTYCCFLSRRHYIKLGYVMLQSCFETIYLSFEL